MMEFTTEILQRFAEALLRMLIHPLYYVGIIMVILQYRKQIAFERKLFHTRLHSLLDETWRSVLCGVIAGLAVSVVMAFVGATVDPLLIVYLWVVTALMMFVRVRFLCFAYSFGILGIVHFGVQWFLDDPSIPYYHTWIEPLADLNVSSVLAMVALLHIAEALLIRWQGARAASPMFFEGKRGKIVGGYQLQGFWSLPLFLIVPADAANGTPAIPWQSLLGGHVWDGGWTVLAFPVVIGFTELALTRLPKQKARWSSGMLLLYGAAVFLLALLTEWWAPFGIAASVLCIALHELLIWYGRWAEQQRSPLFVHDERGLKILAVIPGSPATQLGIAAGEIIVKVNGMKVSSKEQLHGALRINSAFCRMEIINLEGQTKFVQRAMYAGEHHQLGLILSPDDDALYYVPLEEKSKLTASGRKSGNLQTAGHN